MKVITFSKFFPAKHPRKGEETFFVEKIWAAFGGYGEYQPKFHTIRAGNRWEVGEKFSPRIWTGKPYASKQFEFAKPIEIKKIWEVEISGEGNRKTVGVIQKLSRYRTLIPLGDVAKNDGLEYDDFVNWFPKDFVGQVICWNESIEYA